jgi:hypothetical protein
VKVQVKLDEGCHFEFIVQSIFWPYAGGSNAISPVNRLGRCSGTLPGH